MSRPNFTPCLLQGCQFPSHVVMFASGAQFAGTPTYDGAKIGLCLKHGGQVYDVLRALKTGDRHAALPGWLVADKNRLPRLTPDRRGWVVSTPRSQAAWRASESRARTSAGKPPAHAKPAAVR